MNHPDGGREQMENNWLFILSSLKTEKVHDRLGSVRQIIKPDGNVAKRYTYDPFGDLHLSEFEETDSNFKNAFMFTGQELDIVDSNNLKLYYFRARTYHPELNRFLQRDPSGYI